MVRREVTCNIESTQEIKNTHNNLEFSTSIHNSVPAFSFSFKYQVDSQLKVMQEFKILEEEEDVDEFFYEFDQEDVVELLDAKEGEEEEGKILEGEDVDVFFYELDQEDVVIELLDAKEDEEEGDIDIVDAVNMEKNLDFEIQTMPIDDEDESSLADDNEEEQEDIVNSDVENDLSSLVASDRDHPSPLSIASLDSACQDSVVIENQTHQVEDDETDQVYKKYCESMRWYDILSHDRTYGLSKSFYFHFVFTIRGDYGSKSKLIPKPT